MQNKVKYFLWITCVWMQLPNAALAMSSKISDPLKITRATPVFTKPSSQSKVVADLEKDTLLLFRDISPRGTWVLVEDVDGNKGWVPRERTDFKEISEPLFKSPLSKKEDQPLIENGKAVPPSEKNKAMTEEIPADDSESENTKDIYTQFSMDQYQHVISLRGRVSEMDPKQKNSKDPFLLGFTYEFFSPQKEAYEETLQRTGVVVGFLNTQNNFAIPLRLEYLTQLHALSTSFIMGADFGFTYFKGSHWHPSVGYNLGWGHLGKSDWRAGVRPAIEFYPARPSLEIYLGRSL